MWRQIKYNGWDFSVWEGFHHFVKTEFIAGCLQKIIKALSEFLCATSVVGLWHYNRGHWNNYKFKPFCFYAAKVVITPDNKRCRVKISPSSFFYYILFMQWFHVWVKTISTLVMTKALMEDQCLKIMYFWSSVTLFAKYFSCCFLFENSDMLETCSISPVLNYT